MAQSDQERAALRARAAATIRKNLAVQGGVAPPRERWIDSAPTALMQAHDGIWEQGERAMERMASGRKLPGAVKLIARAPGYLQDAVEFAAAKDKLRAAAGLVGSHVAGAAMGAGAGAGISSVAPEFEPLATVAGGVVGAVVGEAGMKRAYDEAYKRRDDIARGFGDAISSGWGPSADGRMRRAMFGPRR